MEESEIINPIDSFIQNIRLQDSEKTDKIFNELLKINSKITQKIYRKIYELGEAFIIAEGMIYVNRINRTLQKNNKNLFLRLIRQEIISNSEAEYSTNDKFSINKKDLEIFPDNPHLLNFKSTVYDEMEEFSKALSTVDSAINCEKKNVDFLRNKALILTETGKYNEAHKIIEYALGIEPKYTSLIKAKDFIQRKEYDDDLEFRFYEIEKNTQKHSKDIKNIKLEFIEMSALFVAILTLVVRIVTIDYNNYIGLSVLNIIANQIAINIPWLIGLFALIILLYLIHLRRK